MLTQIYHRIGCSNCWYLFSDGMSFRNLVDEISSNIQTITNNGKFSLCFHLRSAWNVSMDFIFTSKFHWKEKSYFRCLYCFFLQLPLWRDPLSRLVPSRTVYNLEIECEYNARKQNIKHSIPYMIKMLNHFNNYVYFIFFSWYNKNRSKLLTVTIFFENWIESLFCLQA